MKVLFSNPPWHEKPVDGNLGWRGVRAGSRWPHTFEYAKHEPVDGIIPELIGGYLPFPFWLATAGALAKRHGFDAYTRDSIALGETYESFYNFITEFMPDFFIIETASATLEHDLEIVRNVRKIQPSVKVVFTGLHTELEETQFLLAHKELDYVVYGEYEGSVITLLDRLRAGESISEVPGLIFRNDLIGAQKNEFGKLIKLDELPWAEREDGVPAENYFDGVCGLKRPQLQLMSTRGCPYGCIFCVWPQMFYKSGKFRKRSPQDVVDEIKANLEKVDYKSFYIDDDTFNVNRRNVIDLANLIRKNNLHTIPWGSMGRADLVDDEQLDALVEAGMFSVKYGVESASQQVLDAADKQIDLKKVIKGIEMTAARGIKVHLTFTFGLPLDTVETIEDTIALACRLPCDTAQFSIATPYPGTVMYDMYKENGWLTSEDWKDYVGSTKAVSRTEHFTGEELEFYVKEAYRRFNESRWAKYLRDGSFDQKVIELLATKKGNGKVAIFQSAHLNFTKFLIETVQSAGREVVVICHERFKDNFNKLLKPNEMYTFDNVYNFELASLSSFINEISTLGVVSDVITPYSNDDGEGYEQVDALANCFIGTAVTRVTMSGKVIEK
ncbi:radical SAM protein [Psychromonas sp. SA13A]|uniref:B12-binding domain-containing radical SAM protein n=1 Tax=Psychromonas sp. SA13A TaxID=2686346 RepID=UPI00140CD16C|nr:radical SAM protein [Psychromonas sp. SA13A]